MTNTEHNDARVTLENLKKAIEKNDAEAVKAYDRELHSTNDTYMYLSLSADEFEDFCRLGAQV